MALGATALVFLSLVIGLVVALFGMQRAIDERDEKQQALVEVERERNAKEDALRAMERERDRTDLALRESERTSGFLADTLGELSPKMSGKDVTLREVLDEATGRIATDFETEPRVAARLFATVGRTYLDLGEIEQGLKALRDAYELSKQPQAHGLLDHRLRYAHGYGHALNQVDRLREAEPILEEALELLEAEGTEEAM